MPHGFRKTMARAVIAGWAALGWAQQAAPPAAPAAPPAAPAAPAAAPPTAPPAAPSAKPAEAAKKKKPPKDPSPVPKFAETLAGNPALAARLQALLPKDITLEAATRGFRSEHLFLSTLHASHNLNIPFDQLKADITGNEHDSVGEAIRNFRPALDLKAIEDEARVAEQQASDDVREIRGRRSKSGRP